MNKNKEKLTLKGTVVRRIISNEFSVELDNGTTIIAKKVSRARIKVTKIIQGDKVLVEIPLNQTKIERGDIVGFARN